MNADKAASMKKIRNGKRFLVVALLALLSYFALPKSDTATITGGQYSVIETKNEERITSDSKTGTVLGSPHLLLIRSIDNLPFTRLNDTLECLRHVIETEPNYTDVHRHWVLNRIQPDHRVLSITKLLQSYGENATVIEFDARVYAQLPLNYASARANSTIDDLELWHDRLLYSVNAIGVRNFQLDFGKLWAKTFSSTSVSSVWTLAWTHDMILTPEVHRSVLERLSARSIRYPSKEFSDDYLIVPVQSLLSASDAPDYALVASTRATFRWDDSLRFQQDETAWLSTLGISERTQRGSLWTQLAFGNPVEVVSNSTLVVRWKNSNTLTSESLSELMLNHIHELNSQVIRDLYDPSQQWMLSTDVHTIAYERRLWQTSHFRNDVHWLDPSQLALSNTIDFLLNQSITTWKNREGPWNVSRNDGVYSSVLDRNSWHNLSRKVTSWALASYWTGQKDFGRYAVKQLKKWFWDEETRMRPSFNMINASRGTAEMNPDDLWDWLDITFLLDATKLLQRGDFLGQRQESLFFQWCTDFKEWLTSISSPPSGELRVLYDAITVATAYHVQDYEVAYRILILSPLRLSTLSKVVQSSSDLCTDRIHRQLLGWHILARQSRVLGIHLWKVKPWWEIRTRRAPDDPLYGSDWPTTSALCAISERVAKGCVANSLGHWMPLWDGYRRFCSNADWIGAFLPKTRYDIPALFDAAYGVAPWWNLGYRQ